jgi:hypothetical protein
MSADVGHGRKADEIERLAFWRWWPYFMSGRAVNVQWNGVPD